MKITNKKNLAVNEKYTFYKCRLSQTMIKLNTSKPVEFIYCGEKGSCQLMFKRILKNGKVSNKERMVWCNINGDFWQACYTSYGEACELFDRDIDIAKEKLYVNSRKMKELYETIDTKKINLRKNKLDRLV